MPEVTTTITDPDVPTVRDIAATSGVLAEAAVVTAGPKERDYVVLEECSVGDIVRAAAKNLDLPEAESIENLIAALEGATVYESLGTWTARNNEHAYRQVVSDRFGDEPGELWLVAVSATNWKPGTRGQAPSGNMRYTSSRWSSAGAS